MVLQSQHGQTQRQQRHDDKGASHAATRRHVGVAIAAVAVAATAAVVLAVVAVVVVVALVTVVVVAAAVVADDGWLTAPWLKSLFPVCSANVQNKSIAD